MKFQVEIWAYCLMPNHIHLIGVPETKEGLLLTEDWSWSSAASHMEAKDDILVKVAPMLKLVGVFIFYNETSKCFCQWA